MHVVAPGGARAAQALVVVPDRLDHGELAIARDHARVGPLESEAPAGRIRYHEQVYGRVRARRFGARQGRACYQTAEGGRR